MILERVTATGGFLEHCNIRFSPGLNCVIGSRGTCKSTLIESIRFAFDADPERVRVLMGAKTESLRPDLSTFANMIRDTLGGASVRCDVHDPREHTTYSVERDVQSLPRIYREGVKDHTDTRLLHQIEIYSQGDLQRIAEDEQLRLRLIDRPNLVEIQNRRQQQGAIGHDLRQVGQEIRSLRAQKEQLAVQLRDLPELRRQLEQVRTNRPGLSRELDEQRELFVRRQAAMQALQAGVTARDVGCAAILVSEDHAASMQDAVDRLRKQELPEGERAVRVLEDAIGAFRSLLSGAAALLDIPLVEARDELLAAVEELNQTYYGLRQREQEANESLKKEDALKQQVAFLDQSQAELNRIEGQLGSLETKRRELRHHFGKLGDEIYKLRIEEVDIINERHADLIVLTLNQGSLGSRYLTQVQELLQGSRLRGQDDIAREIAAALAPADLIDLVEVGDTSRLAAVLGRDQVQMMRLMSYLVDSPGLYNLEGNIFEDRLDITMFDEGLPKPVESLSKGQKATALLPLILREAPYPLIFDQPEDDLDNRFIFNSLVQTIRKLKEHRQIIFVTHNANIPVIGEAETVIVMRMESPNQASAPLSGSVDQRQRDIIDLLEGGAQAFIERQRRYESLLVEAA